MKHRNLKSSVLWALVENLVTLLAAVVSTIFAARIIGPEAFGLASIAFFVGSLAETLVATPFAEALIQRRRLDVSVVDTAHTAMVFFGVAVFALLCALAPLLAWTYRQPQLAPLIIGQGTTCLLLGLRGTSEAVLARKLRFKALSLRSIAAKVAGALASVGLALAGAGAWSLILGNVVFGALSVVMVLAAMKRKPKFRYVPRHAVELLRFGFFILLDALLWTATPRLFGFLFGYYQGVRAVGLLNIAFRINDTLSAVIAAVSIRMALPLFAPIAHDSERLASAFTKGTRLTFLIAAPAFTGLALVSGEIVFLFLGAAWIPASAALVIVCLYSLFNFARVLAQPVIKAVGKPALLIWLHLIGLIFVGAGSIVASRFGVENQLRVWAWFGVVYFVTSVALLKSAAGISVRRQIVPLLPAGFAAACMSGAVILLQPLLLFSPAVVLFLKIAAGGLTYSVIVAFFEWRTISALFASSRAPANRR